MLTSIQKNAIPVILASQNVVFKSETGSGKTLAYLVPLLEHLSKLALTKEKISRESGTYCIIFSPTRELCMQIEVELKKLLKLFYYVVCGSIMGGEDAKKEKSKLRKGLTVIICTPGRFLYHLKNTQSINLSHLCYLIMDEADRMLDMGFEKEMTECLRVIKKKIPEKFLTPPGEDNYWSDLIKMNFVSATINQKVERLGLKLMKSFEKVGFDLQNENLNAQGEEMITIPRQIQQFYVEVPTQYKLLYLLVFLYTHQHEKCIVFVSNCELVNFMVSLLNQLNWNLFGLREDQQTQSQANPTEDKPMALANGHIYQLHGNMDHNERKKNYFGFDKAKEALLICTDVASRGLDFKHVEWIIQYDLSSQIKEYVNRVGRTARIASQGQSLCLVMPEELAYIAYLQKQYKINVLPKSRFDLVKEF